MSEEFQSIDFILTRPTINNQFKTTIMHTCNSPMIFIGSAEQTIEYISLRLKKEKERK